MLSPAEVRATMLDDNSTARSRFVEAYEAEIGPAVARCIEAYELVYRLCNLPRFPNDRIMHVSLHVHLALNSVLTSVNLLVGGLPLASGHLMRQFYEAVAIAMLFAEDPSPEFEQYISDPLSYRASGVVSRLLEPANWARAQARFGDHPDNERLFRDGQKAFNHFSHAGAFAASLQLLSEPNKMALGAEFDPGRGEYHRQDLRLRTNAFRTVHGLAAVLLDDFGPSQDSRRR